MALRFRFSVRVGIGVRVRVRAKVRVEFGIKVRVRVRGRLGLIVQERKHNKTRRPEDGENRTETRQEKCRQQATLASTFNFSTDS